VAHGPTPPTYRQRLRAEGLTLAGSGALAGLALLLLTTDARGNLASTALQLAVVAALALWLGPRGAWRAMARASDVEPGRAGSGEPTPLWQLPLIVAALTLAFGLLAGWDAGVRASLGCALIGLTQAVPMERTVAAGERRAGGRYVRLAGSRIVRGTRLGLLR
jgi:lysylphosphatidylglycerol synthetase-like protein (DUF2156 family)